MRSVRGDLDPKMARALDADSSRMRRRRMPLSSVLISPAPLPGASSQRTTAIASCPNPHLTCTYHYAGTPAVALRDFVIRLTTESRAGRSPGTRVSTASCTTRVPRRWSRYARHARRAQGRGVWFVSRWNRTLLPAYERQTVAGPSTCGRRPASLSFVGGQVQRSPCCAGWPQRRHPSSI